LRPKPPARLSKSASQARPLLASSPGSQSLGPASTGTLTRVSTARSSAAVNRTRGPPRFIATLPARLGSTVVIAPGPRAPAGGFHRRLSSHGLANLLNDPRCSALRVTIARRCPKRYTTARLEGGRPLAGAARGHEAPLTQSRRSSRARRLTSSAPRAGSPYLRRIW